MSELRCVPTRPLWLTFLIFSVLLLWGGEGEGRRGRGGGGGEEGEGIPVTSDYGVISCSREYSWLLRRYV